MVVKVSREFLKNFELVVKSYGLTDNECEETKVSVRRDYENAMPCYAKLANEIRMEHGNPEND